MPALTASRHSLAPPKRSWHLFDAVIVLISFTLELSLRGVAQEVASLLIFFRWVAAGWRR
jgi:hypothetical protein